MFLLLNGSFGIGKTTTAALLKRAVPRAAISDPEQVGYVLRRMPARLVGLRKQPEDYQDMALWRRLIMLQARLVHGRADLVIVPMAFTNRAYLAAFEDALTSTAPVIKICLVAPLSSIRERLLARGAAEGRKGLTAFELRRSADCVAAHADPFFGLPIDATQSRQQIVDAICRLLDR